MKKIVLTALLAIGLMAGQYAKLKDGTIIILKDDGTWEKVETVPQGAEAAPAPAAPKTAQPAVQPPQPSAAAPAPVQQQRAVDPLAQEYAQKLVGVWESSDGKLKYIFKEGKATFVDGRKKRTGDYKVQSVKPEKREFLVNIGEFGSAGYFSFGGILRKLRFSPDFRELTDYSAPMPTTLKKVR